MKSDFDAENWRAFLPRPVYGKDTRCNELYDRTWEIARAHVRKIDGMPQSPYMDEGFCDTQIWIWDTCFMSLYCKFAQEVFPGKESFRNFYDVLYQGGRLPEVIPTEREPKWTGAIPGKATEILINIADNPPLLAFAEYENALLHGDGAYVRELLYEKQDLQRHYEWMEGLTESCKLRGVFVPTRWIRTDLGYRWEGGCSGMDNTPRGRVGAHAEADRPNNPRMLWLDAICQQALAANCISKLFSLIGDGENAAIWKEKYLGKKETVNRFYWDEEDRFYYDIDREDRHFYKVATVASYWALTAEIADGERARRMAECVSDPALFGGDVPLTSLARGDADFSPTGKYWRGSLWLPTAYAALKGLVNYGFFEEARGAAKKIVEQMYATYTEYEPHTIWECYSPTEHKPATSVDGRSGVRRDFCGWSALGPISMYIEFVLGFYEINAFCKTVKWSRPKDFTEPIGIRNLRFGEIVTDIVAEGGRCVVSTNGDFTLEIDGVPHPVRAGENIIDL